MELRGLGEGANAPVNGDSLSVVVGSSGVDVLAFQLGADDRVRSDADVVFYNQAASPEGAVRLTGPGTITVLLDLVPASVVTVAIAVAAADDAATSPLSRGLDITLTTDVDGFRWPVEGLDTERAAMLAELYRRNGAWKLRNVSAGWEQGLPALFRHFGVAVDDGGGAVRVVPTPPPPAPALPPPAAPTGSPAPLIPAPLHPARKSVTRKRIAWAAAVLITVLVVAGLLGRSSDGNQNTAQPVPAAAPMTAAPAMTTASPAASSPPASSPARSTVRLSATTVLAPTLPLAAPPVVPVIRTARAAQAAVTTLQQLRVAGRAPKTGYGRAQFGQAWTDDTADSGGHNGCDTRNDILRRDLRQVTVRAGSHGCAVTSGTFTDAYTGKVQAFSSSEPAAVQIDHVVALSNAWQSGAAVLTPQRRQDLANDPLNLQATAGAVNQAKSDGDAATWLPPDKSYRCTYVARQVAVKARYGLWVTPAERQAISRVLIGCGATPLPESTPTPTPTPPQVPARPPAPTPTKTRAPTTIVAVVPPPVQPPLPATTEPVTTTESTTQPVEATPLETTSLATTPDDTGVYYPNCKAARAAGVPPLHRGDPGYRPGLDRDDDGTACEP